MPLVAFACIQMSLPYNFKKSKESNLIKILGCLHGVKRLNLDGFLLQFLAAGDVPERLPTTYYCLKNLLLSINFQNVDDLLVAFCLFRSSTNLHELNIHMSSFLFQLFFIEASGNNTGNKLEWTSTVDLHSGPTVLCVYNISRCNPS
ncbi:F-box/FBD/LRR-repeat protein At1g13570-like [Magnolia sinica]|uniref:F-box/FBD/LRR-repeat protein At1g13570-like n=1 Tax=Magnolia sinica TaxID=86752 RepID=UPI00265A37BB|nr:F-box/FBD/LRR-repeat protein At1g13570-like [Magnolia sinica]